MEELLILVDENDNEVGAIDKWSAHKSGVLHRAFSVFVFNTNGELLLQQRADEKYHSAGLWSNTCCSHPYKGEKMIEAINRRLQEEMGMSCETEFMFSFIYKANLENGLSEHEFDHVYYGTTDMQPTPEPTEVKDWRYISLQDLAMDVEKNPGAYSAWLKICLPDVIKHKNDDKI